MAGNRYFKTEKGNYFVSMPNEGICFYMTPQGKHLDDHEKQNKNFYNQQDWESELKRNKAQSLMLVVEDVRKKAEWVLKFCIKPMQKQFERKQTRAALQHARQATPKPGNAAKFKKVTSFDQIEKLFEQEKGTSGAGKGKKK